VRRFRKHFLFAAGSLAILLLLLPVPSPGQLTAVTATVVDPNGIPYAGAQLKAQLVLSGVSVTGQPTVTVSSQAQCTSGGFGTAPCQVPFQGTVGPVTLDGGGNIPGGGINLQTNSLVTPSGTQWLVTVFSTGVPPPFGTGPHTFSVTVTISGASQSLSTTLNAAAPALTIAGSSVTGNPASLIGTAPSTGSAVETVVNSQATLATGDILQQFQIAGTAFLNIQKAGATNISIQPPSGFTLTLSSGGNSLVISNGSSTIFSVAGGFGTLSAVNIGASNPGTANFTTVSIGGALADSNTAPTISSGFGTSPSIGWANGTANFEVVIGTGGSSSSGVLTMPTAAHGWACTVADIGTGTTTHQTGSSTTSVTLTGAAAWTASSDLIVGCRAG